MQNLKKFKKRRNELKTEIKETKAHLNKLKRQLNNLRQEQQHKAVDNLDQLLAKTEPRKLSFMQRLKSLLGA